MNVDVPIILFKKHVLAKIDIKFRSTTEGVYTYRFRTRVSLEISWAWPDYQ